MAATSDFKNGLVLKIDGQLWQIIEFQHVKPGKGPAFVRTKLKNVTSGKTVDKTLNAGVKVETATVDRRDMTYLYNDGTDYVFMDSRPSTRSRSAPSCSATPRSSCSRTWPCRSRRTRTFRCSWSCPSTIELVVKHTDPGLQGDRSTGGTKPATLETGAEIQVPLFINTGDKLKVDSRDGNYLGRVNS